MRWRKKGLLFVPTGRQEWCRSHAQAPAALHVEGDRYRIFFTARDEKNRSGTTWVDALVRDGNITIIGEAGGPVLQHGPPGTFDDAGAMSSWAVHHGDKIFLYYTGWSLAVTVPFRLSIGLAESGDGGKVFRKISAGPILDRNMVDTIMLASPSVILNAGRWHMWYVSGVRWQPVQEGQKHYYHVRYASSDDGVHWQRSGKVCIDFADHLEYAIARPSVLWDGVRYRMWYCYRASAGAETYRIGFAESDDATSWVRKDREAGLEISPEGWDSEMVCYPYVFQHRGTLYMLYNGNGYGKSGFGYARGEDVGHGG